MLVYRNGVLVCGATENVKFENIEGEPRDNVKLALELDKTSIQKNVLPTPVSDKLGVIYQYIGTTGGDLINGRFYKCVESSPSVYEWKEVLLEDGSVTGAKIANQSVTINKISNDSISKTIASTTEASDDKLPTEKATRTALDLKLNKTDISVDDSTGVITIQF